MNDIFISYAKENRTKAKKLAAVFEAQGYSVWWDRKISLGETFSKVIQEELERSKCVVVMWSKASVTSEWVEIEAAKGKQRGILIPVLIEDVAQDIPIEFIRMQAARLVNWDGNISDPEFNALLRAISHHLKEPGRQVSNGISFDESESQHSHIQSSLGRKTRNLIVLQMTVLWGVLLMMWFVSNHAYRVREAFQYEGYDQEFKFLIVLTSVIWGMICLNGFYIGNKGQLRRVKTRVILGWVISPICFLLFIFEMFFANRGSAGKFGWPYNQYYTQFIDCFYSLIPLVLLGSVLGILSLRKGRKKVP